jgi:hypothetical protein
MEINIGSLGTIHRKKANNKQNDKDNKYKDGGPNGYSPQPGYVVPKGYQRKQKQNDKKIIKKNIDQRPKGDYDGDGVPNGIDVNNFTNNTPQKRKIINPKQKQQYQADKAAKSVVEGAFIQAQLQKPPNSQFASSGDFVKVSGPGGSVIWYKAYWDKAGGNGIQYKVDHVQYNGINYQDVPNLTKPTTALNPEYKKKLDADGDGISGTTKDFRILKNGGPKDGPRKKNIEDPDSGGNDDFPYDRSPASNTVRQDRNRPGQGDSSKNKLVIKGGGTGFSKDSENIQSLVVKGNGNGDNLSRLYQKAYGSSSSEALNSTIEKMKSVAGAEIKEIGKPGQYGYTVAVKTKNGWSTDPAEVKNRLIQYVPGGLGEDSSKLTEQLKLAGANTGGLETSLSNRFARAFHGGDTQKGNQTLMAAYNDFKAKNPGRVRFVGTPGEPGSYIQVKVNKDWVSNSDEVAKQLSAFVQKENSKVAINLNKQQKDLLGGANGNAVLSSFVNKYGSLELAQKNLQIAMSSFEKSNPGNDIRYFGNIGQPGFYIEVKTKDGWVNGTNRILNKLEDHMPKVASTPPVSSPAAASAPESAFAPGATGPNQSASPAQPATSSESTPEDPTQSASPAQPATSSESTPEDPTQSASPSQPVAASASSPSEEQGLQIGFEAGSPEFQQSEDSLNDWAVNRTQEMEAFKPPKEEPASVDLGQAARKSEAMMAFDLDGSGDISAAEKALMANGDQNNNGIVGEKGLKNFVAQADTNNSGLVSQSEVKAYNVIDTNNNNKLGTREIRAYGNVDANNDGDITKKEAKAMVKDLRAQVDLSKQEKKDLDLAKQYLAKSNGKSGGADSVDAQVAALVNSQPKHDKKGDNGPRGVTKKNK